MTPGELAERLARLALAQSQAAALEVAAARLAAAVRDALSVVPGEAPGQARGGTPGEAHDVPWVRSGALRDSIGHAVDADGAVVGSSDPVAAFQEHGTPRLPPRPFLAPVAAALGEALARELGRELGAAIAEGLR